MNIRKSRHPKICGFSLVECIVSLALFATASVMIAQACFNCLACLDSLKKESFSNGLKDYVRACVVAQDSLDTIESGFDIDAVDSGVIRVSGTAEKTPVADLFLLSYTVSNEAEEYSESIYLVRKNWYENTLDRSELIDERKDFLEDLRKSMEN